ncbi:SubName: Full=Uncharacterized protein {ECO:0000313/EMBL:CCA74301.1} [Serendipita indica DSM 11827]|uniref:Uncharacterized protein n=1 Tax=Serendipita indica (strain DSM 11827) TaxID=1109443 RepID=G4TSK8_SERID|nr:SubName: Full=Uncharacterized protein {ECO:0000313/EMBL:CCA74301.1} [Serendipita indica DSM 11827]CCA74301.1 hypothetical protein PIIN_08254 [Serendipita indica DSM 11827]
MAPTTTKTNPQRPPLRYPIPQSTLGRIIWRKWMWVEATFALSMLERWEKILVVIFFFLALVLFVAGTTRYLPHHLLFLTRRARFYLLGNEKETFHVDWPTKAEL